MDASYGSTRQTGRNKNNRQDAKAEILGAGAKFEYRKQVVNFDTSTGKPEFTLFVPNTSKAGVSSSRQIGIMNVGGGARVNGF